MSTAYTAFITGVHRMTDADLVKLGVTWIQEASELGRNRYIVLLTEDVERCMLDNSGYAASLDWDDDKGTNHVSIWVEPTKPEPPMPDHQLDRMFDVINLCSMADVRVNSARTALKRAHQDPNSSDAHQLILKAFYEARMASIGLEHILSTEDYLSAKPSL